MSSLHEKKSAYDRRLNERPPEPDEHASTFRRILWWLQNKFYEWKLRRYEDRVFGQTYRNIDNNAEGRYNQTAFFRTVKDMERRKRR